MIKLNVDKLLAEKGKTRYWLVKQMDSSYPTINKLADNIVTGIRFETIEKLLSIFECDFNTLFTYEKEE